MTTAPAVAILIGLLLAGAVPAPARAETTEQQAERLIGQGVALRRQGRDLEALDYFRKAYALFPTSRAGAQLGFAEAAVGLTVEAERHVSAALADEGDPWVRKNKTVIVKALSEIRAGLGQLIVEVTPTSAAVSVNGEALRPGQLGQPITVKRGNVVVEARQSGYEREVRTVGVTAGETEKVSITLQETRDARRPWPPGSQPVPERPEQENEKSLVVGGRAPDDGQGRRLTGLVLMSGAAVGLLGGVACTWIANGKIDNIEQDARAGRAYQVANGNFELYNKLAATLYVASAVSLAGGGWLFWSGNRQRRASEMTLRLAPALPGGAAGAALAGVF